MNENKRRGGRVSAQRSHGGTRTWKRGGIHPRNVSGFVHRTLNIHVDPAAAARPEHRGEGQRQAERADTHLYATIHNVESINQTTKTPSERETECPRRGAPHPQPDNPSASVSPFALFPFLGSTVWFASAAQQACVRACVREKKRYKSTAAHLEADLESVPTGLLEGRGLKVAANGSKPNLKSRTLLLFGRALAAESCP